MVVGSLDATGLGSRVGIIPFEINLLAPNTNIDLRGRLTRSRVGKLVGEDVD